MQIFKVYTRSQNKRGQPLEEEEVLFHSKPDAYQYALKILGLEGVLKRNYDYMARDPGINSRNHEVIGKLLAIADRAENDHIFFELLDIAFSMIETDNDEVSLLTVEEVELR